MPNLICPKCEEQLNTAYQFKQQCERTDAALREYTQTLPDTIKEENESLDIVVKPDLGILDMYDNEPFSDSESAHSNYSTTVKKKKKVKVSSKVKNRQCKFCNKILTTKEGLKLHERKHTGEKLKTCPACNATFTKTNHLIRHMSLHNKPTDEYKHICQECGMGFTKLFHLTKHKKEYKHGDAFDELLENKEEESVACNIEQSMDENNAENNETVNEVKTEALEEDEPEDPVPELPKLRPKKEPKEEIHPCKVCNKILTTAAGLQIHMRRHTGDNLSTCYVKLRLILYSNQVILSFQICLKTFTKSSHLTRHMQTHGEAAKSEMMKEKSNEPKEKKYMACEFCDRKFVYKKSFLHHIQMEHQISEDSDTPLSEFATIITKPKEEDNNVSAEGKIFFFPNTVESGCSELIDERFYHSTEIVHFLEFK